MKLHDTGRLRAYLDDELEPGERQAVDAHLDQCAACADELELLQSRAASMAARLGDLEVQGATPAPDAALARFRQAETASNRASSPTGWWGNVTRSFEMMKRNAINPRWRPALAALSAVLVVALLLSIAPVRLAAADFLGMFRIRKFAVIPLDQQQFDRLENLANQAEGAFGEPQIVREEGPEQAVSDASQASSLAGYWVRTPSRLPPGATLEKFVVQAGPALRMEFDRAILATLLQAAGAPIQGLPETEKIGFDIDVATLAAQLYRVGGFRLEFIQTPSPQVNIPEGIDPIALAETGFMFLGMPQEDAQRMANSIDWTSTLVVPLPSNAVQAREVTVDGVTGLLLEGVQSRNRGESALVWEKDGILYFLSGVVDTHALIDVADSLQ